MRVEKGSGSIGSMLPSPTRNASYNASPGVGNNSDDGNVRFGWKMRLISLDKRNKPAADGSLMGVVHALTRKETCKPAPIQFG